MTATKEKGGNLFVVEPNTLWRKLARCRGKDINLFAFPYKEMPTGLINRYCDQCPVKDNCLQFAMDNPNMIGLWGGTIDKQRRKLRRLLRKGQRIHNAGTLP